MMKDSCTWIKEFTQGEHSAHLFHIEKKIVHQKTPFQTIDIVKLFDYGKALFLDKRLQVALSDEFIYHELIVHPALVTHPRPRKILVIGGADGGTIRQVLKHKSVKEVTMIEIDQKLTELCQKFLPEISQNAFKNPKLKIFFTNGREFLEKSSDKFDIIISDLTAPLINPPSYLLFTKEFFKIVFDRLAKDGIFSLQADSTNPLNCQVFISIYKTIKKIFPLVRPFHAFIPSYDTSWGFIIASKKYDPILEKSEKIKRKLKARKVTDLKFYDEKIHHSLFVLPKNLREAIKKQKTIIKDNKPIVSI